MKLFIFSDLYKHKDAYSIFEGIEKQLTDVGYEIINPLKLACTPKAKWYERMRIYIHSMMECDNMVLFGNYKRSKTCQFLISNAITVRMKIASVNWWLKKKESVVSL